MPPQVAVGRLVEDVLNFMNIAYWSLFHKTPRKNDPDAMLRDIAKNLRLTQGLIRNHRNILAPGDHARLAAKQRRYHLDLVEEQAREPPYPDKQSRHARIAALHKAVVELRHEALIVTEQAMLPSVGMFPPDEPSPVAPAESTDEMISSLFSKWPALWLLGSHPMACFSRAKHMSELMVGFKFTIGLQLFSTFGPQTRARIPRATIVVGDDGFVLDVTDNPPPASTFFGGLDAGRPRKKARKTKQPVVTVRKLKELLLDVERELPSAGVRRLT